MTSPPLRHHQERYADASSDHSIIGEGIAVGVIGGIVVALWYLLADALAGAPLRTPNILGQLLFTGRTPAPGALDLGAVVGYTVVHFLAFALLGIALTGLVHMAVRDIRLRMGVWFALVIAFLFLNGIAYMLTQQTGQRLAWWWGVGASLLATGAMGILLWQRHPGLGRSLRDVPLGDEALGSPRHPVGRPRL
jgi:hypothetical protein